MAVGGLLTAVGGVSSVNTVYNNSFVYVKHCLSQRGPNKVLTHRLLAGELEPITINVLTRTGTRHQCFRNLRVSLDNQLLEPKQKVSMRHLVSVDNPKCDFLPGDLPPEDVIAVPKGRKSWLCDGPFNLYLNTLATHVKVLTRNVCLVGQGGP